MKKIFTFCSALLCAAAMTTFAAPDVNLTGQDANTVVTVNSDATITGTAVNVQVLIQGDVKVTLDGVNLTTTTDNTVGSPIKLDDGASVELTLVGKNIVDSRSDASETLNLAGIEVVDGTAITIEGTLNDTLYVYGCGANLSGVPAGAGIGAVCLDATQNNSSKSGSITINGGYIFAYGGAHNAMGIGGAYKGDAGPITINGGVIVTKSIGSGSGGNLGTLDINGGTVICGYSCGGFQVSAEAVTTITEPAIVFADNYSENRLKPVVVGIPALYVKSTDPPAESGGSKLLDIKIDAALFTGTITLNADLDIPEGDTLYIPGGIVIDAQDTYFVNGTYAGGGEIINIGQEVAIPTVGAASSKIYAANGVLYAADATSVTVRSLSGQIVLKSVKSEINIDALPQGVYVVQATTPAGINTAKIVNK